MKMLETGRDVTHFVTRTYASVNAAVSKNSEIRCSKGRQVLDHAEPDFAVYPNAKGERSDLFNFNRSL